MNQAASHLVGTHDFSAFKNDDGVVRDAVRTIKWLRVSEHVQTEEARQDGISADQYLGKELRVSVAADGFLYNMVRIITVTLTDVAVGRIAPDDILSILESKKRALAGVTAPPDGLYLHRVTYARLPKI